MMRKEQLNGKLTEKDAVLLDVGLIMNASNKLVSAATYLGVFNAYRSLAIKSGEKVLGIIDEFTRINNQLMDLAKSYSEDSGVIGECHIVSPDVSVEEMRNLILKKGREIAEKNELSKGKGGIE